MEMSQNPVYISMSTAETHTTDHEPIQTCPNILKGINAEANHTHQYKTVDTPIEINQNPVYNIEADYENNDLGPTRNEQLSPEYDYYSSVKL